jgi:hypothetical protein
MSTQYNGDCHLDSFRYKITNKSLEFLTDYFDIVPDGNLFLQSGMPVFAVRMRHNGTKIILQYYGKKHNINIQTFCFVSNEENFSIYYTHAKMLYENKSVDVLKYFNFNDLKQNEFAGIIFNIVNSSHRLMHSIPIVYGKNDQNKNVIILLDPYFESNGKPDYYSSTIIGAKYFYDNMPNIEIYCHNQHIQADHHSCGIFACNVLKNMLVDNAKITKDIIGNKIHEKVIINQNDDCIGFNKINLHQEILKFSQLSSTINAIRQNKDIDVSKYKISFDKYIEKNSAIMRYVKNKNSYNPNDIAIVDHSTLDDKKVNLKILQKGHEYAKIIMNLLENAEVEKILRRYNPDYWLTLIKLEKEKEKKKFRSILKEIRTKVENIA